MAEENNTPPRYQGPLHLRREPEPPIVDIPNLASSLSTWVRNTSDAPLSDMPKGSIAGFLGQYVDIGKLAADYTYIPELASMMSSDLGPIFTRMMGGSSEQATQVARRNNYLTDTLYWLRETDDTPENPIPFGTYYWADTLKVEQPDGWKAMVGMILDPVSFGKRVVTSGTDAVLGMVGRGQQWSRTPVDDYLGGVYDYLKEQNPDMPESDLRHLQWEETGYFWDEAEEGYLRIIDPRSIEININQEKWDEVIATVPDKGMHVDVNIEDIINTPLFEEYPWLRTLKFRIERNPPSGRVASFDPTFRRVRLNAPWEEGVPPKINPEYTSYIWHELQHAVQLHDGLIPGSRIFKFPFHNNVKARRIWFERQMKEVEETLRLDGTIQSIIERIDNDAGLFRDGRNWLYGYDEDFPEIFGDRVDPMHVRQAYVRLAEEGDVRINKDLIVDYDILAEEDAFTKVSALGAENDLKVYATLLDNQDMYKQYIEYLWENYPKLQQEVQLTRNEFISRQMNKFVSHQARRAYEMTNGEAWARYSQYLLAKVEEHGADYVHQMLEARHPVTGQLREGVDSVPDDFSFHTFLKEYDRPTSIEWNARELLFPPNSESMEAYNKLIMNNFRLFDVNYFDHERIPGVRRQERLINAEGWRQGRTVDERIE